MLVITNNNNNAYAFDFESVYSLNEFQCANHLLSGEFDHKDNLVFSGS